MNVLLSTKSNLTIGLLWAVSCSILAVLSFFLMSSTFPSMFASAVIATFASSIGLFCGYQAVAVVNTIQRFSSVVIVLAFASFLGNMFVFLSAPALFVISNSCMF